MVQWEQSSKLCTGVMTSEEKREREKERCKEGGPEVMRYTKILLRIVGALFSMATIILLDYYDEPFHAKHDRTSG